MGSAFRDTVLVEAAGDSGRYRADVDAVWNLRPLPQGGIVTALALRAMAAELADERQRLRTLHTVYAGQVAHGPVDIGVEVIRRGRSMSHLRAGVHNPGAPPGHLTTAVFGGRRDGFAFTDAVRPDVAPPEDCPSFRDPPPPGFDLLPPLPFWEHVEGRPALGLPPWDDSPRTTSLQAAWYRFDDPPVLEDGTLDPLAIVVVADTMPGAVGQRLGRTDRMWFGPSVDLTVHLLDDARTEWLLGVNRARHAGDGYASVEMELWSGETLVAYATQAMFFTFPDRAPGAGRPRAGGRAETPGRSPN